MSWPQAQEYNEAIQNPRICFHDADLKLGSVKTNAMGLPVAISGGFASVYQLTTPKEKWAIRCFLREVADSQRRYVAISQTLNQLQLAYTAPFEFQQAGIRVGNRTFPIVKMQWMAGELLSDYVAKNVSNSVLMTQLANRWATLVNDLREKKLAHGDLQHGNVLVVNHELKLIDYDGMYVPSFQGMRSNEVGHPNFQHPRRTVTDFGLYTDNFSAWVIYVSLRILAIAPEIYNLSRGLGRDECLLFNRDDFANPSASPIFSQIRIHHDNTITKLGDHLARLVAFAPRDVPFLDAALFPSTSTTVRAPSEWWREHIQETLVVTAPPVPQPPIVLEIEPQPAAQREVLGFIIASCVAFAAGRSGAIGSVGYVVAQIAIVFAGTQRLRFHFSQCPSVAARDRLFQEIHLKEEEIAAKKRRLEQNRIKIALNNTQDKERAAQLQTMIADLTGAQGIETKQVYTRQALDRADCAKRKQAFLTVEEQELQAATGRFENDARNIQTQLNGLSAKKAEAYRFALEKNRKDKLAGLLSQDSIAKAWLSGVGEGNKTNLFYSGIRTAADVTYSKVRNVSGFGPTRTETVMAWQRRQIALYEDQLPKQLSPAEARAIDQQSSLRKSELEAQLRTVQTTITDARSRVTRANDIRRNQLQAEENQIGINTQTKLATINTQYAGKIASAQNGLEHQHRNSQRETTQARVSINSLESDIRQTTTWLANVAIPKRKGYESLTFRRYLGVVINTKFQP